MRRHTSSTVRTRALRSRHSGRTPADVRPTLGTDYESAASNHERRESALRRTEAFLAQAQRLTKTGSLCWKPSTGEIAWSEESYRVLSYPAGTAPTVGSLLRRVHPQDADALRELLAQAADGRAIDCECRLVMPDGTVKHIHIVAHAVRDHDGRFEILGAVQDVTQQRCSEAALASLRSELVRVTRATSLGALTASIAHEVNQPLSGIVTNASTCLRMLASEPPDVDGARETARRIIRDGNRAADVISRLRTLFAGKTSPLEAFDLNDATREAIAFSRSEIERAGATIRLELANDLPLVMGDRVQLQQVIVNLLRNAIEAMTGVEDRAAEIAITTARDDCYRVRLSVRDSGVGFDPDTAEEMFDAFYTTKHDGMGIGLSVSRSIIEAHGGRLWSNPNAGPGATFSFSIPHDPEGEPVCH